MSFFTVPEDSCEIIEKSKLIAFLNEDGSLKSMERVPLLKVPLKNFVDLEVNPLPKYFLTFKWDFDSKDWIETASQSSLDYYISEQKELLINKIKEEAGKIINEVLPLYKQVNLMRENPDDLRFEEIDSIRSKSNDMETQVSSFSTIKELRTFEIKF